MNIITLVQKLNSLGIKIRIVDEELKVRASKENLSSEIIDEIKSNKQELLSFYKKKNFVTIPKAKVQEYYPLSSAQKRLYLLQQMNLDSVVYNIPYIISLGAEADKEKIEEVFQQLIKRHESFRTSFEIEGEEPVQRIHEQVEFKLEEFEITKDEVQNQRQQFMQAFDLSQAPLIRVSKVNVKGESSLLMIDMHHIISDGVSHAILEKDFQRLYSGEELAPLSLQYKDYSEWQNSEEQKLRVKKQEDYWIRKFEEEIPVLNLPIDKVRPAIQSHEGASVSFALSKEETKKINLLAKENGLTLYMSILSVFNILLSKLSGQEDIVVGMPIAGRTHSNLENIVGMFVNTLALRNEVNGSNTLKEFTKKLKQSTLEAFENQDYQFEELVEKVNIERDISRNPIFDVVFNLLNQTNYSGDLTGLDNKELVHTASISKFDLTLTALDYGEHILFNFEYCTKLFNPETIERFIKYFKQLVGGLYEMQEKKLSTIEIITEEEKNHLLYNFNDSFRDYQTDKTIIHLFEEQVKQTPENIAIVSGEKSLSYIELNQRSNQLARHLIEKGISNHDFIGVINESSLETYVGILGILKAGKAYLPVDVTIPDSRIQFMLEDCRIKIVLASNNQKSYLNNTNQINVKSITTGNSSNLNSTITSSNPVYVIYTSGSTGKPKGVVIEHKSLVNLCIGHNDFYGVEPKDRISKYAGFGFDASVWEFFPSITSGASLYLIDENIKLDPEKVNAYFEEKEITISFLPTQFCEKFMEYDNKSLRILLTGGDKLNSFTKRNFKLYNNYGPTENTVVTTRFEVQKLENNIPIGKPIENNQVYILNQYSQLQAIGVPGELCIGGIGLSQGYLNNRDLTKEKFTENPFKEGERLYKTGDLVRWLPCGNIQFLGRIDHQVKIRGFRIELGEIENVLKKHVKIKDSVVIAREENGDKYLCAYIVYKEDSNQEEIRDYLTLSLPDYMVPSYFVELDSLPLTSNGKVDKRLLPEPEIKVGDNYIAPRNEIEEKLVVIWSEVLNIEAEKISVIVNFFDIGGHSIKAINLISKIHKEFSVKIPIIEVFKHQTIEALSAVIKSSCEEKYYSIEKADLKPYYNLSSAQKRLFILQQMNINNTNYNMPLIVPIGDVEPSKLDQTFKGIINRHDSLRTKFYLKDEIPVQEVLSEVDFTIERKEISISNQESFNQDLMNENVKPFDLSIAPLLRVKLLNVTNGSKYLFIDMHHIITDGTSQNILTKEFMQINNGEELEPLALQYKDYSEWQNSEAQQLEVKKQEEYWLDKFSDELPILNLPYDFMRPGIQSYEGASVSFVLNSNQLMKVRKIIQENNTTLYTVMLSFVNLLLHKICNQEDIIIGTPVQSRRHPDLNNIIGMFANTLAIRTTIVGENKYSEYLEKLNIEVLRDFENQDFQFDNLVEKIYKTRDIERNPIFDVVLNLLNYSEQVGESIEDSDEEEKEHIIGTSKFDLIFTVMDYGNYLAINIEYCVKLFKQETINKFIKYFKKIITDIINNTEIIISEIDILDENDEKNIINISQTIEGGNYDYDF